MSEINQAGGEIGKGVEIGFRDVRGDRIGFDPRLLQEFEAIRRAAGEDQLGGHVWMIRSVVLG